MKKNLLIAALAIFGCATGFAQEAEETTEKLLPTADTYLRYDSPNDAGNGGKSVIEIKSAKNTEDEAKSQIFYGLMGFDLPLMPGYDIESATLVFFTQVAQDTECISIYPFGSFTENDTYNSQKDAITAALEDTPFVTEYTFAGIRGRGIMDVNEDSDAKYKTIDGWKNEIDVTEYIKGKGHGNVGFLFTSSKTKKMTIFTKDANAADGELKSTIDKGIVTDFSAEAVKPYLLVEYTKNGEYVANTEGTVTSDVTLCSDNPDNSYANNSDLELNVTRNEQGEITSEFVGLMQFNVNLPEGAKVYDAKFVFYTARAKGSVSFYDFDGTVSDNYTYNSQKENIDKARQNEPIATVRLNGTQDRAMFDTDKGASTNLDDWKNELDLTDYVKQDRTLSLLLCNASTGTSTDVRINSSDATDVHKNGKAEEEVIFKGEDIRPRLFVTYTTSTPTGIDKVVTEEIEPVAKGKEGIYTLSGVRVAKADQPGIYIINGKKVLVGRK